MIGRIYTIPTHKAFLKSLLRGLERRISHLCRHRDSPDRDPHVVMARTRIYLPTRRAAAALRDLFDDDARKGRIRLLPQIIALGDIEGDIEGDVEEIDGAPLPEGWEDGDIPPPMDDLERQAHLTRLIAQGSIPMPSLGAAWRMGGEIARLIDTLQIEDRNIEDLENLSLEEHSAQWQKILALLRPIREAWPAVLESRGRCDPVRRSHLHLERQCQIWQGKTPAQDPVIIAGTTGSRPATARLMRSALDLPLGCVVLPGFDIAMPEGERSALNRFHHQYIMHRLLREWNVTHVRLWHDGERRQDDGPRQRRIERLRRVLAPAPEPPDSKDGGRQGGIRLFSLRHQGEEAALIAAVLRQSCEEGAASRAALITADRSLARRVVSQLRRWNIDIADSANSPLSRAPAMIFLRLLIRAVASQWAPIDFLALLRHPYSRVGLSSEELSRLCARIETRALLGPRPRQGIAGLRQALNRPSPSPPPRRENALLEGLESITHELAAWIESSAPIPAGRWLDTHYRAALALARGSKGEESPMEREDRGAVGQFFRRAIEAAAHLPPLTGAEYPSILDEMARAQTFAPTAAAHPRLFIWGLLEARLQSADRVILGGLNEDSWPRSAADDIWLNHNLCAQLGISPPEWRIGASCHDFVQAFGAREVILTRSRYKHRQPTHPTRWLVRMQHLLEDIEVQSDDQAQAWMGESPPSPARPLPRPTPKPPRDARKKELYVNHIEELIRDPYAHYARHILKLRPRPAIDEEPDRRHFGQILHEILADFTDRHPRSLPEGTASILHTMVEEKLDGLYPRHLQAHWRERMRQILDRFQRWEEKRREQGLVPVGVEVTGSWRHPSGEWSLHARADRIDRDGAGRHHILDYKTAQPPSRQQVIKGFYPQLLIQGLIFAHDGYPGLSGLGSIRYRHLNASSRGLFSAAALEEEKTDGRIDADTLTEENVRERIEGFLERYFDPATPLMARPRPSLYPTRRTESQAWDPFDHLSRLDEWSSRE